MIYLDNNATTPLAPEVLAAMLPYLREHFGNPSSPYAFGRISSNAIGRAREQVAALVGAAPDEIVFTSGGTESINTVFQLAFHMARKPTGPCAGRRTIVTTTVEHSATRSLCRYAREEGFQVVQIPVDREGQLDVDQYLQALNEEVLLVSIMTANNETGLLFPIESLAGPSRAAGALFHTDAVQAVGKMPVSFENSGADFLSLSAHKFHGPKGVGALAVRTGSPFVSCMRGGDQERTRRAGTENVAGIVGLGTAAELALRHLADMDRVRALRDEMESALLRAVPALRVVGREKPRLPNTSSVVFPGVEAEALLMLLDLEAGVSCSTGSACTAGSVEPSHVLTAYGFSPAEARQVLRFSLSRMTTKDEVDRAVYKSVEFWVRLCRT